MPLFPYRGVVPSLDPTAFVAPGAAIIGDVVIGANSSVWFNCTVRGDVHEIRIGDNTNVQDGTVVHVTGGRFGTYIGSNVTIGHGAVIHACTLQDGCFIGMGATILDGAVVESGAMVAAGALVAPGKRVPAGQLWAGNPAKLLRPLKEGEAEGFEKTVRTYVDLGREYRATGVAEGG